MRRLIALSVSVAFGAVLLFFGSYVGGTDHISKAAAETKPNIVFILTDDMRKDDLNARYMPQTTSLLQDKGMTFTNAFVSNALCCPSRATIMRGQYSHNNGVWSNSSTDSPSTTLGGWQAYQSAGDEADNVATRLQGAGYRTGLFGKYLNGYTDTTYKPPGWNRWFAAFTSGPYHYFDYDVNDDGTIKHYGTKSSNYLTDVLSTKTNAFISTSASQGTPFFTYVAPLAPHLPSTPAPRDTHTFDGEKAPRLPSFNEGDVSDKPSWIRQKSKLTSDQIANIDNRHEKRIESLQAVDDLVAGVVDTLTKAGVMNNTYIFFTSDNGWHHGEHRIPSEKWRPYEEDIHMPLLVVGPGVAPGSTTDNLVLNTDYLSTFMALAGTTQNPTYVPDGRSLLPVLNGTATPWRSAILLEAAQKYSPPYYGIRTSSEKYMEYADTAKTKELYNLITDPNELVNYPTSPDAPGLAARLQALETCAADTCVTAENGP